MYVSKSSSGAASFGTEPSDSDPKPLSVLPESAVDCRVNVHQCLETLPQFSEVSLNPDTLLVSWAIHNSATLDFLKHSIAHRLPAYDADPAMVRTAQAIYSATKFQNPWTAFQQISEYYNQTFGRLGLVYSDSLIFKRSGRILPVNCDLKESDYDVLQPLAAGQYGAVYLAIENAKTHRFDQMKLSVMKRLSKYNSIRNNTVREVILEAQIMSILRHPFIVNFNGIMSDECSVFLNMEYCSRGNLFQVLRLNKRLSEPAVKFIAVQLLLALTHCHRNFIVFGDLKPENVLVHEDGYIRLADFGLASPVYANTIGELVYPREKKGSPLYMAPEVYARSPYGYSVDYWALACLIYEMFDGCNPYERLGQSEQELGVTISKGFPSLNPDIPASADAKGFLRLLTSGSAGERAERFSHQNALVELFTHPWLKDVDFAAFTMKSVAAPEFVLPDTMSSFFGEPSRAMCKTPHLSTAMNAVLPHQDPFLSVFPKNINRTCRFIPAYFDISQPQPVSMSPEIAALMAHKPIVDTLTYVKAPMYRLRKSLERVETPITHISRSISLSSTADFRDVTSSRNVRYTNNAPEYPSAVLTPRTVPVEDEPRVAGGTRSRLRKLASFGRKSSHKMFKARSMGESAFAQ